MYSNEIYPRGIVISITRSFSKVIPVHCFELKLDHHHKPGTDEQLVAPHDCYKLKFPLMEDDKQYAFISCFRIMATTKELIEQINRLFTENRMEAFMDYLDED